MKCIARSFNFHFLSNETMNEENKKKKGNIVYKQIGRFSQSPMFTTHTLFLTLSAVLYFMCKCRYGQRVVYERCTQSGEKSYITHSRRVPKLKPIKCKTYTMCNIHSKVTIYVNPRKRPSATVNVIYTYIPYRQYS